MFTRADYMNNKCTHEEYYEQMAECSNAKSVILDHFTINELDQMYTRDKHLNWVPVNRRIGNSCFSESLPTWDALGKCLCNVGWSHFGDCDSYAGRVCVLKAAVRVILKERGKL
jgi:hypothetical protein